MRCGRIGARDLEAVDHVGAVARGPEQREFADVVLRVAVGVEDPFLARGVEARSQRAAVAAVHRMRHHAQARAELGELVEHFGGAVAAAVVDDDHFPVVGQLAQRPRNQQDLARDRSPVVVGGEEGADAAGGGRGFGGFARNAQRDTPAPPDPLAIYYGPFGESNQLRSASGSRRGRSVVRKSAAASGA